MFLCRDCLDQIKFVRKPLCEKCGKPHRIDLCANCRRKAPHYSMARASAIYDGVLRECIHELKYRGQLYLGKSLGKLMVATLVDMPSLKNCDLIVPVPLHRMRERERGFNQAFVLAKEVSRYLNVKISSGNFRRTRRVRAQTELSGSERVRNVRGIFSVRDTEEFKGKTVLLIDDVLTTGSTADESSRVLLKAGAGQVFVLTLARGE